MYRRAKMIAGVSLETRPARTMSLKNTERGTSLVAQWLRLHAPNAGDPGSFPGQGTRSHMPQLTPSAAK